MSARGRAIIAALPALLWLTGCDGANEADPMGNVTASEAQALNDAAAMLDGNAVNVAADNARE